MSTTLSDAPRPAARGPDPLRELFDRMNEVRATLSGHDPRLSRQIEEVTRLLHQPDVVRDEALRTRAAYAHQDFSRLAGPVGGVPEGLRAELGRLANSAPGLENERIRDLLREVPDLRDRRLAHDIRTLAVVTGKEGGDQYRPDVMDKVEALERRVMTLSPTFGSAAARHAQPDLAAGGPQATATPAAAASTARTPQPEEKPTVPASPLVQSSVSPGEGARAPRQPETGQQATQQPTPAPAAIRAAEGQAQPAQPALGARDAGPVERLVASMVPPRPASPPPWEPQPTPITERIAGFLANRADNKALEAAEASGQRAVEALRGFAQGAGAAVMARISEAARTDPRGMEGVLAEMREGGRHADLRTQFNNALVQEKGLAAAYDAAASAVKQYGTDRQAAEAVILKRSEPAALAGRFERLDAAIGEAASHLPSRQEGKSVVDELGQKVAELVRRAADAVRNVFQQDHRQGVSAASSPSPSP
ncbi:hypothetical protein RQ846_19335 [Roseomonas mucosa]|uniref:hypothetical protein n=1 Tax=Roseomonas mucosa TaxID=207340 RepID=UPI0028CC7775|nr:hypothetical protein [Roseomonas mucosa]MDT8291871.1 hypothetical protein [Roseomonas mucosa]